VIEKPTIVIGDVHGCFFTLQKLLKQLPKNAEIIFVGDLCDRGNYTKEVIECVLQNNYVSLLGNHESYMLESVESALEGKPTRWIDESYMGGKETLKSYKNTHDILVKHLQWIAQNPLYILKDNYFITHGFALPYYKRRDIKEKQHSFLVNRVKDIEEWGHDFEEGYEQYDFINVFGHETFQEVMIRDNLYGIDTSCVYGNKLSALELGSMKVYEEKVHPLDISKITAVDITEHFGAYTEEVIPFKLDAESILFDIPLTPQNIDDALQKMSLPLKEFFNMFSIAISQHTSATSLRLNYDATLSQTVSIQV